MVSFVENLRGKLDDSELEIVPKSFDVIGSIAIVDFPEELRGKREIIAEALMQMHSNVKTVLSKESRVKGRLRTKKLGYVLGEKTKEAIHKETGCRFKLDVEKCYFSPRLSNDRIDIMKKVRKGERVLVMFAGVGPYSVIIAKNSPAKIVYSVELNRIASKYAQENVLLNKLVNMKVVQGDVRKVLPKLKIKFDRIVMARPQLKDDFLDAALKSSKKGTIIHFYDFLYEAEMPQAALEKIETACKLLKKRFKVIEWKRAIEIGPRKWRVRIDFQIL